ncbi:uncharacterized protein B0P05DRAFT_565617, partial [Gilbertella persicaria]|uniref:uncharacterized protein n=1 Tax=Gilbertella persicaria TaxID=101096 RepID=UPI0022209627
MERNATNCDHEPAIHGQSPCFYTKDNVCNEIVSDKKHPFCCHIKEPEICGQAPTFYCGNECKRPNDNEQSN